MPGDYPHTDPEIDEIVSAVETESAERLAELANERQPWFYLGWCVFCQENGKPIGLRPEEIVGVRPGDTYKVGLTLKGRDKTVIVYGEFLDVLDMTAAPIEPMVELTWDRTPPPLPVTPTFRASFPDDGK